MEGGAIVLVDDDVVGVGAMHGGEEALQFGVVVGAHRGRVRPDGAKPRATQHQQSQGRV
jgi:hypothetical protein